MGNNDAEALANKLLQRIAELEYQNAVQAVAIEKLQQQPSEQANVAEQARKK